MIRAHMFIIILLGIIQDATAQNTVINSGIITFKAAKNIYVRFDDTDFIIEGDTIYSHFDDKIPCMVVIRKSSSSVVCHMINDCNLLKNDTVYHNRFIDPGIDKESQELDPNILAEESSKLIEVGQIDESYEPEKDHHRLNEKLSGRFSMATQSNFSNLENQDRHRLLMRLTVNADNISNSRFSFQSYINHRKNFISNSLDYSRPTSFYNVYNLAINYQFDDQSIITLGRKINQKISSVGPIDGIQAEKRLGSIFMGGILGFKPDVSDFGFNADLLEYGGYLGHEMAGQKVNSQSTVGLLEQRNNGNIDRRYGYFQHSSSYSNTLSLFTSAEIDLYENIGGVATSNLRLTNIYTSLRIKPARKLSITISYDARRKIILYETFRTDIEQLLADDQARQGLRLRININPIKYVNGGISFNKRFQNDSENKSDNLNAYIGHSRMPMLMGRITINYNKNSSNYVKSTVFSMRYTHSLIKNSIEGEFYYRFADYNYFTSESISKQQFIGSGFSFRLSKKLVLSILGEYSTRDTQENLRINTRIIKRFYKK